jgi:toxin CptA
LPEYAAPLCLKRRPSRILIVFLVAIHGGALGLLPWLALPWGLVILLGVGVMVSGYLSLREQALLATPRAIVQVSWDRGEDSWHLYQRDGRERVGKLFTGYFIGPRLVILNFVLGPWWRRVNIVFLPDNTDPESLRRLRVRMQIRRS